MAPLNERFELRLDEDILTRVDQWRMEQGDAPSRAEAMRRLVEMGLTRASKTAVEFSDGEKLLVIMMRDLLKHLKVKGEIDLNFIGDVIWGGHYWAPKWDMTGLFHDMEDDPKDLTFVVDVLNMWRHIERAYAGLSKKDKAKLAKEAEPCGEHVAFCGFDGNMESSCFRIADFLVERMGRFSEFKGRDLNSHMPTVDDYRKMLRVFAPIRDRLDGADMNVDQLVQILRAKSS